MAKVYIETTVVSYLTARPSRDVVVAGHQESTREWWDGHRHRFELVTSNEVLDEAAEGDPAEAKKHLEALAGIELLDVEENALSLAKELVVAGAIPMKAATDALHLAVSVVNGVDYLVTWNCKHLANASIRRKIDQVCQSVGYSPIVICTPEELIEEL